MRTQLLVIFCLFLLTGCGLDMGIEQATKESQTSPPSVTAPPALPTELLSINGVEDGETYLSDSVITVTGYCQDVAYPVVFSGSFLVTTQNVNCSNGIYSIDLNIRNLVGASLALQVSQAISLLTSITMNLTVSTTGPCGGATITSCAVGGLGTVSSPYLIDSISCLQEITDGMACYYELNNDLDATITSTWNGGEGWMPIGAYGDDFTGTIDGKGFKITNLFIDYQATGFVEIGLIGATNGSTIKNITLENINYSGASNMRGFGAFVGWATNTIIENVTVSGQIIGNIAGGGDSNLIGGLVGRPENLTINNAHVSVDIENLNTGGGSRVGGLVGGFGGGVIINNSYYSGTLNTDGVYLVGGLVGQFEANSEINNSFMAGSMTQTVGNSGALVGGADNPSFITNSFWHTHGVMPAGAVGTGAPDTNDNTSVGALAYFYSSSNPPMDAWNFVSLWEIDEGNSLPELQ